MQIILFLFATVEYGYCGLLRTPKVYNALITTDQNLTPSRAYPVVQPTIQAPYFYSPLAYNGFNPYGFYDPYASFNFGNIPGYVARYNSKADTISAVANEIRPNEQPAAPAAAGVAVAAAAAAATTTKNEINSINAGVTEKSPIPLNEFGLPPSLIPISPSYNTVNHRPVDLAPYSYNSYPLIFDQYGGFQQGPYLPHFGFLPQSTYANFGGANSEQNQRQNEINNDDNDAPGKSLLKIIQLQQLL